MGTKRIRRLFSVREELIAKSRESALTAIQTYNNPLVKFKSETFIVLMVIAWTYMLHAYFRSVKVEYRYWERKAKRRRFVRTTEGAYKYWELSHCLGSERSPLDEHTTRNLRFLIGLRNEIEHHMSPSLDDYLSARYQACCANYNHYLKQLFGDSYGIDDFVRYSIQFVRLEAYQVDPAPPTSIPRNVLNYIAAFDKSMTEDQIVDHRFSLAFLFTRRTVNSPGQADRALEFVSPDSSIAEAKHAHLLVKAVEKRKYKPKQIVEMMRAEGFTRFDMHDHTSLWRNLRAKDPSGGYGVKLDDGQWYWYDRWVSVVRDHCRERRDEYT